MRMERPKKTVTVRLEAIMSEYDDIINRIYTGSTTRKRMSMLNRAAQFAPFAALTGHDAAINETARLTFARLELSSEMQQHLSARLNFALNNKVRKSELIFTVFIPDKLKSGGKYIQVKGIIKKYDEYNRIVILTSNRRLSIDNIVSIEGNIFEEFGL